ncbi:MAG: YgaP family membrane protein [Dehalococcoidia bacterium]
MKPNEGSIDRAIRLVIAAVLIGVGLGVVQGAIGIAMAVVGVIPLLTGLSGYCPLYTLFGINTRQS